jgi:hypothetical protein
LYITKDRETRAVLLPKGLILDPGGWDAAGRGFEMRKVRVEKAVGMVLAHDITRIVPGKFKGVGFKKGHIVREEDIPELLKLGKRTLFVMNLGNAHLHEDEAALRIARAISGEGIRWTDPSEGKTNLVSVRDGVLKVDVAGLLRINRMGSIIVSTLKTHFPCRQDQTVAATRIIPLTIPRRGIERLEALAQRKPPIIDVLPYRNMKVGGVVTGSEIAKGLVKDAFDQYVGEKVKGYGSQVVEKIVVTDDVEAISRAILRLRDLGCDLILTTGGLSVDPDDVTRRGIGRSGARILFYGTPILPGAMFLYARLDGVRILGLPACVYYHPRTIFDLVLPRVLAGEEITKGEVAAMGHGGLCLNCEKCRYPVCPFGK